MSDNQPNQFIEENLDQNQYALSEDDRCLLLKQSLQYMDEPAFLCRSAPENPHFLEIIECNDLFLKCFGLERIEVVGNNYDFLLQDQQSAYGSDLYFEQLDLIKTAKNLQVADTKISITNPKDKTISREFRARFIPSRYKTKNVYCIISFEELIKYVDEEGTNEERSEALIQNLERSLRNEKLLRSISGLIVSEFNLKEVAEIIAKVVCEYLKIDRCILYSCNDDNSGFLAEYCTAGIKKISDSGDLTDPNSPLSRYINLQNQFFLDVNHLKKTTTMMVHNDIKSDTRFEDIQDVCKTFGIGSQIIVTMASNGVITGGFYLQQSENRNWIAEESELIEIISRQFSMAIDRSNYTQKLLVANQNLMEKSNELVESLAHEKRMRELQSEFVALVSHQFKTPLQIIDGARELILRKSISINIQDELISKSLERIKSAIERMNHLILSNLNLSKIEIGEDAMTLHKQNFDIKNLIKDIVEKNSHLISEKNIRIDMDINNLPNSYIGDPKLLDHSFTNIIVNAVKYSKSSGVVEISGGIKDNNLFFKVVDHGIGIPEDELEKIGTKFFRAKNTLSVAGTGIGLYLSKYFIELHSGQVSIESQLNVGTSITALLPISH